MVLLSSRRFRDGTEKRGNENMAEYGIVLQIDDIKGNCALNNYEKAILVENIGFSSISMMTGYGIANRRITVDQTPISATIAFGPWAAEFQQACYTRKNLKKAIFTQLAQQVDSKTLAEPTVVQRITLTNPVIELVSHDWSVETGGGARLISVNFNCEKILFEIDKKTADFTNRNFTAGAV